MRLFHQTRCESKKIQVGAVFPHQMCNFTHRVYNLGSVVVIYAVVCECKRNNRPKNFVNRNIWKMLHSACPQSSNRIVQGPTGKLTARLKWKKGFLAAGFPIFWRRWSDQTFSIIPNITKTEKTFCCWFFLKTKYLSNILVKIVASRLWIRYKTWLLKKIQWCWPPAEDLF